MKAKKKGRGNPQSEAHSIGVFRCIKIKGPNPSVYSEMAWNNLISGNMEQASTLYETVLNYNPTHRTALINLAKINYRLGKYKISRSYVDRVLKQDLLQTQLDDLNELLKKLSTY